LKRFYPFLLLLPLLGYIAQLWLSIPAQRDALRIALHPWPGYELLQLANERGYFAASGLDVDVVEISSLSDVRRAFERGRVDAMTCTLIEAIEALETGQVSGRIVLLTDLSAGADALLALPGVADFHALKGQRVAVEGAALSAYLLHRALELHGLKPDAVETVHYEAAEMEEALAQGDVVAAMTYAPHAQRIQERLAAQPLFDSSELPGEIVNVLVVSDTWLARPGIVETLQRSWDLALQSLRENREEAIALMAARQGLSPRSFAHSLDKIHLMETAEQERLLSGNNLSETVERIQRFLLDEPATHSASDYFYHDLEEPAR
jgi:NitT/TauT family transport system substrate-binding protein